MKRIFTILSLIVLCGYQLAFANISADDIIELNNATPGTFKVQLGTVFSEEQANIDTNVISAAAAQSTANTALGRVDNVSLEFLTTDDTSITTITDVAYIRKFTGSNNEGINLVNGETLQTITIALTVDGGGDFAITPDTSSGFDQINLTTAGDNVALRFIDSTIGWTLIGVGSPDAGKVVAPIQPFN